MATAGKLVVGKMILDLCPYWTHPTTGGGPERVHHLCRSIARVCKVTEVSFRPTLTMMRNGISPLQRNYIAVDERYSEFQIPHVPTMIASRAVAAMGLPQDLYISQSCSLMKPRGVSDMITRASAVQIEHPWQFRYAERFRKGKGGLILSTHNCETKLVSQQKGGHETAKNDWGLRKVMALEAEALKNANHVITVSDEDISDFSNVLGVDIGEKVIVASNGVDCRRTAPPTNEERDNARDAIGVDREIVAVFLGSRHPPNVEAVRRIERMMPFFEETDIKVVVVGSAGEGLTSHGKLVVTGHVPDYRVYLRAADIALNPLETGSGTSLKALEYFAAGIPVVTTSTGVRGLNVKDGAHAVIAELDDFPAALISVAEDNHLRQRLASEGRLLAETEYDWEVVGRRIAAAFEERGFVE